MAKKEEIDTNKKNGGLTKHKTKDCVTTKNWA